MKAPFNFWVPMALLAWAGVLWLDPAPFVSPVPPRVAAPAWATDPTPVRQLKLQPEYRVAGYAYQCMDCHRIIPSPAETFRKLTQHTEIRLNHGINTRCFNCHHPRNRNAFVDDFGAEIPWNQPQLLCAKCHGPVYRDWQAGSHGRINGYWDSARGPQTKLRCIVCHDPHHPPFQPLPPRHQGPPRAAGAAGYARRRDTHQLEQPARDFRASGDQRQKAEPARRRGELADPPQQHEGRVRQLP